MPVVTHRRSPAQSRPGLALALLAAALGGGCATLADPGSAAPARRRRSCGADAAAAAKPAAATSAGGAGDGGDASARARRRLRRPRRRLRPRRRQASRGRSPTSIKDANETPGLFRVWQKDDKVWIEIAPEQFDLPFLFPDQPAPRHRRSAASTAA